MNPSRSMSIGFFLAVFSPVEMFSGCGPVPHYMVHRAALVAPPAPPMWSGKTEPLGFTLGNSTVVWKNPPKRSPESDSGLYVAGTQMDGNFRLTLTDNVALWFPLSYGFQERSFAAAPCLIERPSDGVFSGGIGMGVTFPVSETFYLGGSFESQLGFVPSRIRSICVENCEFAAPVVEDQETATIVIMRASFLAGVDFDWVRLFAGFSVRNHPTNVRITREMTYVPELADPKVEFGPLYGLAGAGAEFKLGNYVNLLAQIYQPFPLAEDDLIYGPILGISIDIHTTGKDHS